MLQSPRGSLSPVVHSELPEDMADMRFDRLDTYIKLKGNFLVELSGRDQP